jgi:glycosyltransferase involved in cell wall biosynthesis
LDLISSLRDHYVRRRPGWQLLDRAGNLRDRVTYLRAAAHQRRGRRVAVESAAERVPRHSPLAELRGSQHDSRPRVLVCDWTIPTPDRDSGSHRMDWILRLLSPMCSGITLVPSRRYAFHDHQASLQRAGVEVVAGDHRPLSRILADRPGFYDLIILSRARVAQDHLATVRRLQPQALVMFDTVELTSRRLDEQDRTVGASRGGSASRERALEDELIRSSDVVATVCEEERSEVLRRSPESRTVVLPNVHAVARGPVAAFDSRRDLIFVGNFTHPPNVDAVHWFGTRVMSLIRAELDIVLRAVGPGATRTMAASWGPHVRYEGWVPDAVQLCAESRISVAPLRYGAGVKGKIGQALSLGLPVVTTSAGASGMDLDDGVHVLMADEPKAFADAIVRLHSDVELWQRLSAAGIATCAERWSPEAMQLRLEALLRTTRASLLPDHSVSDNVTPGESEWPDRMERRDGTPDLHQVLRL